MSNKSKRKGLVSLMLALVMVFSMSTTVMAGTDVTVNDGDVSGATYVAYQLMTVTTATAADNSTTFAYTVNNKYSSLLQTVTGTASDEAVISYISALSTSAAIREFADDVYNAILAAGTYTPEYTSSANVFSDMDAGYYLIAESATGTTTDGTNNETYSMAILRTIYGDDPMTVLTKEDVPTLTKQVWEVDDSTYSTSGGSWQDAADYDVNDVVKFRLIANISDYFADYDVYKLVFHDTLDSGFTFNSDSLKVYVVNGTEETELSTSDYTVTVSPSCSSGCSFHVTISDLTNLNTNVSIYTSTQIRVEYTATLNSSAVTGAATNTSSQEGNANVAYLEYSNNAYDSSSTGRTTSDRVTVFTYALTVNKVDNKNYALVGAGFTLYKWVATGSGSADGDWEVVGTEIVNTTGSSFSWTGLDAGLYKLEETTVPNGYTKASDITFKIVATYDTSSTNPTLTNFQAEITGGSTSVQTGSASSAISTGVITMGVYNTAGNSLPLTGSVGTAIFTVVGVTLMLAAAVLGITRRRVRKQG